MLTKAQRRPRLVSHLPLTLVAALRSGKAAAARTRSAARCQTSDTTTVCPACRVMTAWSRSWAWSVPSRVAMRPNAAGTEVASAHRTRLLRSADRHLVGARRRHSRAASHAKACSPISEKWLARRRSQAPFRRGSARSVATRAGCPRSRATAAARDARPRRSRRAELFADRSQLARAGARAPAFEDASCVVDKEYK